MKYVSSISQQLFGTGLYAFVEDTFEDPDICPFDTEPPRTPDKLMFAEDPDQTSREGEPAMNKYESQCCNANNYVNQCELAKRMFIVVYRCHLA